MTKDDHYKIPRKGIVKFDPDSAKTLPLSAGRERYKGFEVSRTYNNLTMKINGYESLNGYDLITLLQMLDDYQKNDWGQVAKIEIDGMEKTIVKREFNLSELCKQRGISSNKHNRMSIAKSFERWYRAEVTYIYPTFTTRTRYIFEYKIDDEAQKMTIVANENFLKFCLETGMAMNWQRLIQYGKNAYAVELDVYMQFRSMLVAKKTKKYRYPSVIREETLFEHVGLNKEVKEIKAKRNKLKEAFKAIERVTGQKYLLKQDEKGNYWAHTSYLKYIENKNKKA